MFDLNKTKNQSSQNPSVLLNTGFVVNFSKNLSKKKLFLGILFIKHKNFLLKIFSVRCRRNSQGFLKSTPATSFLILQKFTTFIILFTMVFSPLMSIPRTAEAAINEQIN